MGPEGPQHLEHLRARGLRPNTIDARRLLLARLEAHLDDSALNATLDTLRAYLDRGIGDGTKATEIAHLRAFYRWALIEGLLEHDPTIRLERPSRPDSQPRPIATRDLAAALTAACDLIRPMLYLAAYAGLRACEIAPLRGEHLLLTDTPPILIIAEGKGGRAGAVPISSTLRVALTNQPRRGWLFPRLDGRPGHLSRVRVGQLCNELLHDLEIDATLHQLRHWFGTETYRATHDIRLTQRLMRHRSSRTTDGYTYIADSEAAAAVELLPDLT